MGWWRPLISVELVGQACLCILTGDAVGCWNNTQLAVQQVVGVASVCGNVSHRYLLLELVRVAVCLKPHKNLTVHVLTWLKKSMVVGLC